MTPPLDDYASWMERIDRTETEQARLLGEWLYEQLRPQSVIDWGCASGLYLVPFRERGCEIAGLDAEPTAGRLIQADFFQMDLRQPVPSRQRDLALCIEVGEHLQPEYADILVENVAHSAPVIVWSAATPGQGGRCHHNEQPWEYWFEKFKAHGFGLHPLNGELRTALGDHPEFLHWLKANARLLEVRR